MTTQTTTPDTKFKSGNKPKGGRPKGSPNKVPTELKEMILGALNNVGGVEYLERKANDPRTAGAFLSLVSKVLPMTMQGPNKDGSFTVNAPWLQQAIERRNS